MVELSKLTREIFSRIDAGDADGYAALLDEASTASFGNIGPIHGRENIRAGYLNALEAADMSHNVLREWVVGPDRIVELEVTYTRKDGKVFTFPAAVFITVNTEGLVSSYRIYIDQSSLYGD